MQRLVTALVLNNRQQAVVCAHVAKGNSANLKDNACVLGKQGAVH